jgi:hypothetical protein
MIILFLNTEKEKKKIIPGTDFSGSCKSNYNAITTALVV